MNEDFVTFEISKKLKEKWYYNYASYWGYTPTIHQVLKWLREEKYIDIAILPLFVDYYKREYKVNIYATCFGEPYDSEYFHSYEKAELFAINYVLDNLI